MEREQRIFADLHHHFVNELRKQRGGEARVVMIRQQVRHALFLLMVLLSFLVAGVSLFFTLSLSLFAGRIGRTACSHCSETSGIKGPEAEEGVLCADESSCSDFVGAILVRKQIIVFMINSIFACPDSTVP